MMKYIKVLTIVLFAMGYSGIGFAQPYASPRYACQKNARAAKTTVADVAEDNYDITYLKFNLAMNNDTTYISGDVSTTAMSVVPSLSTYVFELNHGFTIDSVMVGGVSATFTSAGDIRSVSLPSPVSAGSSFTAQVFYHGTPIVSLTIFGSVAGINSMTDWYSFSKMTFTQSESYHASEWWPCKQSLRDKIDSVDMWITIPDSLKAGSNGLLNAITTIDPTHVRYEWKERYPIDYYLISASVAPYQEYAYYMHFTGSSDSMLVQNYLSPNPYILYYYQPVIDSTALMIDYFSTLYGRYPFWKEKYGHCMAPLGGGMEHQTMTTLGYFSATIVAHELGHQWFGDNVTCGSWADIMMNEGFASYTEDLYLEHFTSHAAAISDLRIKQDTVKDQIDGAIYTADTSSEDRIFDSRLSYDKGACMLHMLRFLVDYDTIFFNAYRAYQSGNANGNGTIADFRNTVKSVIGTKINGVSVDSFFDQWAYKQGYPIYDALWNQKGDDVYVQLNQSSSYPSSVPFFTLPMEIRLHSAAKDTVIRVLNDQPSQVFHFTWSNTMLSMATDPNYWLVYKLNGISHDTTLSATATSTLAANAITISPNPSSTNWTATRVADGAKLSLTDISGRQLWHTSDARGGTVVIPSSDMAPGVYLLSVTNTNGYKADYKLIRR